MHRHIHFCIGPMELKIGVLTLLVSFRKLTYGKILLMFIILVFFKDFASQLGFY